MLKAIMVLYFLAGFVVSLCNAAQETISHEVVLDGNGKVRLSWTVQQETINMEVVVEALGYVGIGFSPTGGMKGSDIVLAWVTSEGDVVFKDMHASARSAPAEDDSQDYELLRAEQNDTHTTIRFRRTMATCDVNNDFPLSADTIRIIYAYSDEDPQLDDLPWHGVTNRGTKSVYLTSKEVSPVQEILKDYKTWDVKHDNLAIPNEKNTVYWCRILKVPKFKKKHHVVGYSPIVTPGNEAYVHHMMVYECAHPEGNNEQVFEKYLDEKGTTCYSANMPDDWGYCRPVLAGWAVGGEGQLFPENAGTPLTEKYEGSNYFMLEVHYDNPLKTAGIVDSSGMRIYYTDKLREYDAGTLILGYPVTPFQVIPPKQSSFTTVGICSDKCTETTFPATGIKAFQVILHAHLSARSIRLRHFRNGTELPVIAADNHYDFNFQQTRSIQPEVTVLPGDTLVSECIYNTEDRNRIILGGLTTKDEMCLVILSYYPRVKMGSCLSYYSPVTIAEAMGVPLKTPDELEKYLLENLNSFDPVVLGNFAKLGGPLAPLDLNLLQYLVGGAKWTEEIASRLHNMTTKGTQAVKCTGDAQVSVLKEATIVANPSKEVGSYSKAYLNSEQPEFCKKNKDKRKTIKLTSNWKSELFRKMSNSVN